MGPVNSSLWSTTQLFSCNRNSSACSVITYGVPGTPRYTRNSPANSLTDAIIESYRECIENLPPIVVARCCVLVDGFHRWQAHKRENIHTIQAEDLGNLTDVEIFRESIERNSTHGFQLGEKDKKADAAALWLNLGHLDTDERYSDLCELFSVSHSTIERWTKDAREQEKKEKQEKAWDMWLDCYTEREIAAEVLGDEEKQKTINSLWPWGAEARHIRASVDERSPIG